MEAIIIMPAERQEEREDRPERGVIEVAEVQAGREVTVCSVPAAQLFIVNHRPHVGITEPDTEPAGAVHQAVADIRILIPAVQTACEILLTDTATFLN